MPREVSNRNVVKQSTNESENRLCLYLKYYFFYNVSDPGMALYARMKNYLMSENKHLCCLPATRLRNGFYREKCLVTNLKIIYSFFFHLAVKECQD
jgi:hypothetical protein